MYEYINICKQNYFLFFLHRFFFAAFYFFLFIALQFVHASFFILISISPFYYTICSIKNKVKTINFTNAERQNMYFASFVFYFLFCKKYRARSQKK